MALLTTGYCVSLKASTLDRNFTLNLVDQSNILSTQLKGGIFIRARKATTNINPSCTNPR